MIKPVLLIKAYFSKSLYCWDLAGLARECPISRTRFSNQFRHLSGWTVMQYLTWWRMPLAWAELAKGLSVYATAEKVGYLSEPAFSRAFKKAFGVSAGQVKRNGDLIRKEREKIKAANLLELAA